MDCIYVAFLPNAIYNLHFIDPDKRMLTLQWLQAAIQGIGPIFGSSWCSVSCSRTFQRVVINPEMNGQPSPPAEPQF